MGWSIKLLSPCFPSSSVKLVSVTYSQSQVLFKWDGGWHIIFTSPDLSFLIDTRDNFSTLQGIFCYCRYDIHRLTSPINSLLAMASVIQVSTHPSSRGNSNTHALYSTPTSSTPPYMQLAPSPFISGCPPCTHDSLPPYRTIHSQVFLIHSSFLTKTLL